MYLLQEQENVIVSVRNTICLNTCSNGMTIEVVGLSHGVVRPALGVSCLNPYSNGMTIEDETHAVKSAKKTVLILVLME